jgi:hypothetical protein
MQSLGDVRDIKVVMATNMVPTATVDVPLRGGQPCVVTVGRLI